MSFLRNTSPSTASSRSYSSIVISYLAFFFILSWFVMSLVYIIQAKIKHYFFSIFSITFPFATSSTSLSRYRISFMSQSSISCILYPQIVPVISVLFGLSAGDSRKNFSKSTHVLRALWSHASLYPVSHMITSSSSDFVRHFFSTFSR